MRHTLSISFYGGLMAIVFNYANVATFSIPSLQFSFMTLSFFTGFLITYLALWLNNLVGPFPSLGLFGTRNHSNITQPPVSNKKISKVITNK